MKLDKESTVSLYMQLMHVIKEQIHNGTYLEGEQIPTEGELSKMYNISRITIRRAIEELCQQGYLKKIQGKGTFVEAPKIYRKLEQDNNISFTEACKLNGCTSSSHVISFQIEKNKGEKTQFLQIGEESFVYHIQRILSADRLPVIFEDIYMEADRFPDFPINHLENGSLTRLLEERYQICRQNKGRSIIEVGIVPEYIAHYLQVDENEPVMLLKNYMYDGDGRPLYLSSEVIVGTRYQISV